MEKYRTQFWIFSILIMLLTTACGPRHVVAPIVLSTDRTTPLAPRVAGRVGPADIYPDPNITPGVAAKDVTQENIQTTICVKGFTNPPRRPPTSYTNDLKIKGFADYGLSDHTLGHYEEDHLISLELGGDPIDPHNLWPEPYAASIPDGGAYKKDSVERYLNGQVCHGKMTLEEAQKDIVEDWYKVYKSVHNK